jgi:hypothetical protein
VTIASAIAYATVSWLSSLNLYLSFDVVQDSGTVAIDWTARPDAAIRRLENGVYAFADSVMEARFRRSRQRHYLSAATDLSCVDRRRGSFYPSDHLAPGLNLAGFCVRDGGVLASRGDLRVPPLRVSVLRDGVGCEEELEFGMQ